MLDSSDFNLVYGIKSRYFFIGFVYKASYRALNDSEAAFLLHFIGLLASYRRIPGAFSPFHGATRFIPLQCRHFCSISSSIRSNSQQNFIKTIRAALRSSIQSVRMQPVLIYPFKVNALY